MNKAHRPKEQRKTEDYGTGESDHLTPTQPLDLSKVTSVDDLMRGMSKTAFGARNVGEAADVLEAMVRDKDCTKILTLSGAMTVAKMGLVVCDMIDHGLVDIVISTGALMAHGFIESAGMKHYKYEHGMNDSELYKKGYNRVYDTLEPEKNFEEMSRILQKVLATLDPNETQSSYTINRAIGEYLDKNTEGRGILKSAYQKKIPVYIPAFTDSELAFDFSFFNEKQKRAKKPTLTFDSFLDFDDYNARVLKSKKLGIFTIGGGVPRNWAQQASPYWDIYQAEFKDKGDFFKRFDYGVRISPDAPQWGGLSGCTYSEGVSWGKFTPQKDGGRFAEVYTDATMVWPFIVKAVLERLEKKPR